MFNKIKDVIMTILVLVVWFAGLYLPIYAFGMLWGKLWIHFTLPIKSNDLTIEGN